MSQTADMARAGRYADLLLKALPLSSSLEEALAATEVAFGSDSIALADWVRYEGPHGGRGWRSTRTNRIVYQETMPAEREESAHEEAPESTAGQQGNRHQLVSDMHEQAREHVQGFSAVHEQVRDQIEEVLGAAQEARGDVGGAYVKSDLYLQVRSLREQAFRRIKSYGKELGSMLRQFDPALGEEASRIETMASGLASQSYRHFASAIQHIDTGFDESKLKQEGEKGENALEEAGGALSKAIASSTVTAEQAMSTLAQTAASVAGKARLHAREEEGEDEPTGYDRNAPLPEYSSEWDRVRHALVQSLPPLKGSPEEVLHAEKTRADAIMTISQWLKKYSPTFSERTRGYVGEAIKSMTQKVDAAYWLRNAHLPSKDFLYNQIRLPRDVQQEMASARPRQPGAMAFASDGSGEEPPHLGVGLALWERVQGPRGGWGWRNSRTGEMRYQSERPADRGGRAPEPATGIPPSPEQQATLVAGLVKQLGQQRHNIVSLVDLRRALAGRGVTDRQAQDMAIWHARKAGRVTSSPFEGRHGITPEEREAAIQESTGPIGFLHLKAGLAIEEDVETVPPGSIEVPPEPSSAPADPPQPTHKHVIKRKTTKRRRPWRVRKRRKHLSSAKLSVELAARPAEWAEVKTRAGKTAWKNARTGEVRYQQGRPGERRPGTHGSAPGEEPPHPEEAFGTEPPGPGWTYMGGSRWRKDVAPDEVPQPVKPGPQIAVIGGGPGGLFTAYLLNCRFPGANVVLFEASERLGGKLMTDCFSDGTPFEAGVAELYEYKGPEADPLRLLIEEDLGLKTRDMSGGGVILEGHVLKNLDDLEAAYGHDTRKRVEAFHKRCSQLMPLEKYATRWQPDNDHPWADCCFRDCIRTECDHDPAACAYIEAACHSDLATESRTCNGLNGIKNVLLDNDEYMQLYHVRGGIERVAIELAGRIDAAVLCGHRVQSVCKAPGGLEVCWRKDGQEASEVFDAVVVAMPNHWLEQVQFPDQPLAEAVHGVLAHYDLPAHYLRVSLLFGENWWKGMKMPGEFWMMDLWGGCCVYDECARWEQGPGHCLSWLLAGGNALIQCSGNDSDGEIVERLLESLPSFMQGPAKEHLLEAQVDRFAGAVNAQPGGWPVEQLRGEHQPATEEAPGLFLVGDYFFDSTLNAALVSAATAVDLLLAHCGTRGAEVDSRAVMELGHGTD
jgi:hypothetical protein